ncbi:hypothetical protein EMCRGX_G001617 [Ephydatia muelleri]|eukprot:Em0058g11a
MDSFKLNTGAKIPALGLGTWQSKPGEVAVAVEVAIKAGYRHVDCAHVYKNEEEVGSALEKCIREGVVKREDLFFTSKLWSDDQAPDAVEPACRLTLKNLKLEYLDLYLVHNPFPLKKVNENENQWIDENNPGYDQEGMAKTWKAMEELVKKGLTKAIGISNFTITKTENLLKTATIVPAVNQVECHPYFQQPKLKEYCDSKGIMMQPYSPLGSPGTYEAGTPNPLEDDVIKQIAVKHNATPAHICISFQLHRGMSVIPKSVNPNRIKDNFKASAVKLNDEDMERIRALDRNLRLLTFSWQIKQSNPSEDLWDTASDAAFVTQK